MFVVNGYIIETSNRYCDGNIGNISQSEFSGILSNCIECPEHALCEYGNAVCRETDEVLHPTKGCLPMEQYSVQMNSDKLYAKLVELLKHKRRLSINHCDNGDDDGMVPESPNWVRRNQSVSLTNYGYVMTKREIEDFFRDRQRLGYLGMNAQELEVAMVRLFKRLLTDPGGDVHRDERFNGFVAEVPQWEYESHQNCTKLNMLMVARTFGLELTLSVVSVTALLVSCRKMTTTNV